MATVVAVSFSLPAVAEEVVEDVVGVEYEEEHVCDGEHENGYVETTDVFAIIMAASSCSHRMVEHGSRFNYNFEGSYSHPKTSGGACTFQVYSYQVNMLCNLCTAYSSVGGGTEQRGHTC